MSNIEGLYQSPIPDTKNAIFVENRILINKSHDVVFDWVTTWSNLPKWLPVAMDTEVLNGRPQSPSQLGDILWEAITPGSNPNTAKLIPKHYTVVAHVPGHLWVAAGEDGYITANGKKEGCGQIKCVATFATFPQSKDSTLFTRSFVLFRDKSEEMGGRKPVVNAAVIQNGLERLKVSIESM